MRLSIKHIRVNMYTLDYDVVPPGTPYGFWRVVEHTGAGWFPWPDIFRSRGSAEAYMRRSLEKGAPA